MSNLVERIHYFVAELEVERTKLKAKSADAHIEMQTRMAYGNKAHQLRQMALRLRKMAEEFSEG